MDWLEAVNQPFPAPWKVILEQQVPFYQKFDDATRQRFEEKLKNFIFTKDFFAQSGLIVDDSMKVLIAATACRLSVNLPGEYYSRLQNITIFKERIPSEDGFVSGLGSKTKVSIVWDDFLYGLKQETDGYNIGYHEFAHSLDDADGALDGQPRMCPPALYGIWIEVIQEGLEQLRAAERNGWNNVLDKYGAKDEVELFAVATETFFEKPRGLSTEYPELYSLLAHYYHQDPARQSSR
jgi:MtfA peptidase